MNMKIVGVAALAAACAVGCCKKDEALVTVNGRTLTRCELDKDVASLMKARQAQIPAEQVEEYHRRHPQCEINTTTVDPTEDNGDGADLEAERCPDEPEAKPEDE